MSALNHFDAIVFGCNGTLIDRDSVALRHLRRALGDRERRLSDDDVLHAFDRLRIEAQYGRPILPYDEVLKQSFTGTLKHFGVRGAHAACEAFAQSLPQWQPYPECHDALEYLAAHFRLGLACNTDTQTCRLFQRKLQAPFEVVVTAERVGAYKPDPRQFVTMMTDFALLGVPSSRLLFVGSNLRADIAPVSSLGLYTVHIDRRRASDAVQRPASHADEDIANPHLHLDSLLAFVQHHRNANHTVIV